MILSKVMLSHNEEALSLVKGKYGLKYAGIDLEAMQKVIDVNKAKSVTQFREVLNRY